MRAVQVIAPGKIELIDLPKPAMEKGKVLARTTLASICGSDWPGVLHGRGDLTYPMPPGRPGHEVVCVVEESDSPEFAPGDLVLDVGYDGSFREFQLRGPESIVKLPANREPEEMLMSQPLGVVMHAARKWPSILGKSAVVIGQGTIGLLFTALLKNLGAGPIIALDLEDNRLTLGRKFGSDHQINTSRADAINAVMELTGGQGADMVVEAVGTEKTYDWCAPMVRKGGMVTFFGLPKKEPMSMHFVALMRKDPVLFTSNMGERDADFAVARDLIASGKVYARPLITHRFPLDQILPAHELAESRADNVIKILLEF